LQAYSEEKRATPFYFYANPHPRKNVTTQVVRFTVQGCLACGGVAFFILLDIVDEPMNGSSYAQCATPQYIKTVQFSSVNLEP